MGHVEDQRNPLGRAGGKRTGDNQITVHMNNVKEILEKLTAKQFDALLGLYENGWLEAKGSPYVLDSLKQKLELAKDVSALANSNGGIILLGFKTTRDALSAGERISKVEAFPLERVDSDRILKLIQEYVYPPPEVHVITYDTADGRGVAAIVIGEGSSKPHIVTKMTDDAGTSLGAHFGYFERKHDVIPSNTVHGIQHHLALGQRWGTIDQRLQAIESSINALGNSGSPKRIAPAVSEQERNSRLKAARVALGRDKDPLVYYLASPEGECDFPTLLRSRGERVVRLIERPPALRAQGFGIWANDASEILHAHMRRNMLPGNRLIELWRDGVFIFIAPGDEDFLGWRTDGFERPIHINNFVLAESTLTFCWLMKLIYEEADPRPTALRLAVGFDNLARPSGQATLSSAPEGTFNFTRDLRQARQPNLEVFQFVDLAQFDPARVAYLLMADIYNWFGYEGLSVPYINMNDPHPKLLTEAIIGGNLPETVPTPPYC